MHHTLRRPSAAVALALTLLACSDPGQTLDTIPPTVSTPAPVATVAPTATQATSTTAPATTITEPTPTTEVSTTNTLALTDGPWTVVDSIPEVTEPGLYYELSLPGLYAYFPEKINDDDPVFWNLNETDRPIIEAYLNAQLTINQAISTRPMDFNLAGWDLYFEDGGAALQAGLKARSDDGFAMDIDLGIVMRPWIIEDERTETTTLVVDCIHDGSLYVRADGTLSQGSFRGWGQDATITSMVLNDGVWRVESIQGWEDACAAFGPR